MKVILYQEDSEITSVSGFALLMRIYYYGMIPIALNGTN